MSTKCPTKCAIKCPKAGVLDASALVETKKAILVDSRTGSPTVRLSRVNAPKLNVNSNPNPPDQEPPQGVAARKSPIVNRRTALAMALRQAFSAVQNARGKATHAVLAAGAKLNPPARKPEPPSPPSA